jgi:hypothetical protein
MSYQLSAFSFQSFPLKAEHEEGARRAPLHPSTFFPSALLLLPEDQVLQKQDRHDPHDQPVF